MANRTPFITYELNGLPVNAYSVQLASEDGTYSIKELNTGIITIPSGQTVNNTEIGRYEYTFLADDTKTYLVSWEIVANPGNLPAYKVQQIGPLTTNADRIRAVSDFKGTFKQGTSATLLLKITNFDGIAQDPSFIQITIKDLYGVIIKVAVAPEKAARGFYAYQWDIPSSQTIGGYVAIWEYIINGVERNVIQNIEVADNDPNNYLKTKIYSGRAQDIRLGLESYLMCAQNIPVYYEQAKTTIDNKTYRLSFSNWNQSPGCKIYRNMNKLLTDGFEVDYFNGQIVFDQELSDFDSINVDYNFRWFSDETLYLYLINAINTFNSYPPMGNYNINNVPTRYIPFVQKQAAVDAIRQMMLCLQFQEPQKVFGGAEQADKVFSNLETIKRNYEEEIKETLGAKINGSYVNLTRTIISPEFSMPGGRSLVLSTQALMKIGASLYNVTLRELYDACRWNDLDVRILSEHPITRELVFAPIKYIWVSGVKRVYELLTKSGHSIASSNEHLFYANGKYQPLMHIKEGDEVIVSDNGKKIRTVVKKVKEYRHPEKMYDLEVFGTANLFANGIKCHNSRWMRYLFTSGT
jgi:hypothetical protein